MGRSTDLKPSRYLPFLKRGIAHDGPPLHLTLFVTGRCNLRCRHCFHWKEVAAGIGGPSLADVRRLADSAARMGPLLWVSFGGGEPFLRDDLPQLAQAFGRHELRHLAIPTNGLVGSQNEAIARTLELCPETFLSIAVSFDGPPAVHDEIRQVRGGHARSMDSVRALRELAREQPRLGVGVMVTVTRENQDSLAHHVRELVHELRPDNLTINLARGTALDESLLDVDVERYLEVIAVKRELVRTRVLPYFDFPLAGMAVARDELMYEHVARVARAGGRLGGDLGPRHLPCTAGRISAVVFEDGRVEACEMLGETMGRLDEVDWDLGRIWSSAEADALRARIRSSRCRCTWECAQADNVLFHARNWPRLAGKALTR